MIKSEDLKWYKAEEMSDAPENGGPMSTIEIQDGVKNDVFNDVTEEERSKELTRFRKQFICNTNEEDVLLDATVYVVTPDQEEFDSLTFSIGTPDDRQVDVQPDDRRYGCAKLVVSTRYGLPYLVVRVSECDSTPGNEVFHEGDLVYLTDDEGHEFLRVKEVWYDGCLATLTLKQDFLVSRIYNGGKAWVSSVYEHGDLKPGEAIPVWERRKVMRSFKGGRRNVIFRITGGTEE